MNKKKLASRSDSKIILEDERKIRSVISVQIYITMFLKTSKKAS